MPKHNKVDLDILNQEETARFLGVSVSTLQTWRRDYPDLLIETKGRHGRACRFSRRKVEAWHLKTFGARALSG